MAVVHVQGNGWQAIQVGLGMFALLVLGLSIYGLLGDRSFVGMMSACVGGVFGLLAPIPLYVGWKMASQRIDLVDDRLSLFTHERSVTLQLRELDNVILLDGPRGWAYLSFSFRGEFISVDTASLDRAAVATLVDTIRAARPDLPTLQTHSADPPART